MAEGKIKIGVELDTANVSAKLMQLSGNIAGSMAVATNAFKAASTELRGMGQAGAQAASAMASGLASGGGQMAAAASGAVAQAKSAAMGQAGGFSGIGMQMCNGVASGIRAGAGGIVAAINAAAAQARAAFQSAMQIQSPSKVMAEDGYQVSAGITKGIEAGYGLVGAAMRGVGAVIMDAAPAPLYGRAEQIQKIERQMDEYERMMEEKEAAAALREKRAAIRDAKNKKERVAAQQALNDHLRSIEQQRLKDQRDALEAEQALYEQNLNALVSAYDFLGEQIMVALRRRYEAERDIQLERIEQQYRTEKDAAEQLYLQRKQHSEAYILQLEAERDAQLETLQGRIDEINQEAKAEKEAARAASDEAKLIELQAAVDRAKNAKFRSEAQLKLDEEIERQKASAREREREAQIALLKEQMADTKAHYAEERELEQARMDESEAVYKQQTEQMKLQYEARKEATEAHFKALLKSERLAAEARYLLLQESNEEMMALLDSYNPQWYDAGKSFGALFVSALGAQMENVYALIEQAASFAGNKLDMINQQIQAMQSAGSGFSSGTGGASGHVDPGRLNNVDWNALQSMDGSSLVRSVNIEQTVNINQPVQSPSEVGRAVQMVAKELAYGI